MWSYFPHPTWFKDVRSFLGSIGFYRCFIKYFSKIVLPLTKLLQKEIPFIIDDKSKVGFDTLKEKLISTPIWQLPNCNLPFKIKCDASDYALGAVLGQRVDKKLHAMYCASITLN